MLIIGRDSVAHVYDDLRLRHPSWSVDLWAPSGPGWIAGAALRDAVAGPFHDLLVRIGERQRLTADRQTVAASFALRLGWTAGIAIAPYVTHRAVPDAGLDNLSFKFTPSTFFERAALHEPRGTIDATDAYPQALLRVLRDVLVAQAEPVVRSLHDWSRFSVRGIWGQVASSWASQFVNVYAKTTTHVDALPTMAEFFEGSDLAATMRPRVYPVELRGRTHVYQRRASCCRYYLVPGGDLCASCPLVGDEERRQRNVSYMDSLLKKEGR